jgi:aminocarboxymuconate-semialdehyde decarboxylase
MGEDRVMLGSDYPYPLGEQQVGSLIRSNAELSERTREKLLHANATRFFGLEAARADRSTAPAARLTA